MIKRFRQRRAVKTSLRFEAREVAAALKEAQGVAAQELAATRKVIQGQLFAAPDCPMCGTPMEIHRVSKGPESGLQKWVCSGCWPRHEYLLSEFPYSSEAAVKP